MGDWPRLPGFQIEGLLGSGGMGTVYRARSIDQNRPVAIKVGDEPVAEHAAQFRERFLREVRILQGLRHENLPDFVGAGETSDGRPFLAMELLSGRPLSSFVGQPLEVLLPLLIQCARALQVIAEAGVVHRDVSPDNFFVVEVGGRSVVKLIDFGISRDAGADLDGLTRAGMFLGKPDFCSPEQAGLLGPGATVDWRTDLYSFGLVIFHLVTGKILYLDEDPLKQIRVRANEVPGVELQRIMNRGLRRLVAKMLRVIPDDRPGAFGEVIAELLRAQSDRLAELASETDRETKTQRSQTLKRVVVASPTARPAMRRSGGAGTVPGTRSLMRPPVLFRIAFGIGFLAALVGLVALLASRDRDADDEGGARWPLAALGGGLLVTAVGAWGTRRPTGKGKTALPVASPVELPADSMQPLNLQISGDGSYRVTPLILPDGKSLPATIVLGRAAAEGEFAIRFESRTVSGRHALLTRIGSTYQVENLSRTNATVLNGRDLAAGERLLLAPGDVIQMGEVTVTFQRAKGP
jgi:serine/threonine protein kinase